MTVRELVASLIRVAALALFIPPAFPQHEGHQVPKTKPTVESATPPVHDMQNMPGMDHESMSHDQMSPAAMFLMSKSSGTALQPAAWPMPMLMTRIRDWHLMWMGQAFLVETQQSGPRGGGKLYSNNWGMLGAIHELGGGSIMFRSMLSLEPATVTNRRYPLLFQTGETAYGAPLADGQHPHDFVMELSAQYAHSFGKKGTWNVYYAPVGDPALGPVAFPHRASAMELPQASLGHHWQDSTHIANNLLTAGVSYAKLRVEASGFHGREPGEARWNIDWGAMDSWATRVSFFPTTHWAAQFSVGRLNNPEISHPGSIVRTTASVEYARPAPGNNFWATSVVWGQNHKLDHSPRTNAVLAETVVPFQRRNFFTGRFEWSQRDELLEGDHTAAEQLLRTTGQHAFNVAAFTAGYTRDVEILPNVQTGIGVNVTAYAIPSVLTSLYGRHPWGANVFLRVRLKPAK